MILDPLTSLDALGRLGRSNVWYRSDAEYQLVDYAAIHGKRSMPMAIAQAVCDQYRSALAIVVGAEAHEFARIIVAAEMRSDFSAGIDSKHGPGLFRLPSRMTGVANLPLPAEKPMYERPRVEGHVAFAPAEPGSSEQSQHLSTAQRRALLLLRELLPFQAPKVGWDGPHDVFWTVVMDRSAYWSGE